MPFFEVTIRVYTVESNDGVAVVKADSKQEAREIVSRWDPNTAEANLDSPVGNEDYKNQRFEIREVSEISPEAVIEERLEVHEQ